MIGKLFGALNKEKDRKLSIESKLNEQTQSDRLFGSSEVEIPIDGAHAGQSGWPSANAWDIKAPIGEPVYAIANGTVTTFEDYGPKIIKTNGKKLYGAGFTVKSTDGLPNVFYTHLQNVQVRKGSSVQCGQLLGYVMDMPGSSYDHVHIGVEWGHNIREFLNDDGTLKCSKGSIQAAPKSERKKKFNKEQEMVWNTLSDSVFLKKIMSYVQDGLYFEYTPGQKIPYEQPVEVIQSGLQFLGFSLPKYGVDGKYGPETQGAVKDFQSSNGLPQTGIFGVEDSKYLLAMLIQKGFSDSNLRGLQYERDFDLEYKADQEFYETLLRKLGAPITNENMKFLLAWRQAEGKAGNFNPFNTTHKLENSTDFNSVGVQNYQTLDDGMYATLRTLTNGRYNCIVSGLINDIGASEIAKCSSLKTWGTGDLVEKVIDGYENGASIKSPSLR
jgi:peptidoglycan hydrolase-like protein with peptidoglycan-binding domain